jgi:hypothetical protein
MTSEKQYQRLAKEELQHDDDDDDDDDDEGSALGANKNKNKNSHNALSLVDTTSIMEDLTHNNIFRSSAWKADRNGGGGDAMETTSTTTAGSTTSSLRGNNNSNNIVSSVLSSASASASKSFQLQGMLTPSRSHSRASSNESDDDSEWDDDDDVDGVQRYHLDFEHRETISIPGAGGGAFRHESLPKRTWRTFLELRVQARQRRAARLLTMPSESFPYKLHACLLTWCCDATDRGILTVVGLLTAWLLVGWAGNMSAGWWGVGLFLFAMRVTARRLLESCLDANRKRMRRRQRLHTSEAAALESESASESASTPGVVAGAALSPPPTTTTTTAAAAWGESDATTSLQHVV